MNIAIIPARGGSKRIPRKNIKLFCGLPMIAWSINVARSSGCFDRVIVSTDDVEIANIALSYGAEVPFLRPANLSNDHAGTNEVVSHAIRFLQLRGQTVSAVCCVYATAPFIRIEDLKRGLLELQCSPCDYVFSATTYSFPVQRAIRLLADNRVEMLNPEHIDTRSQDLETVFHDAGQFYWGTVNSWLKEKPIFSQESKALLLPRHRVQDIDTLEDWNRAELMFRALQNFDR